MNTLNWNNFGFYILPTVVLFIILNGLWNKIPVFDNFLKGASEGIQSTLNIAPALIALVTVVTMLKSSGALDIFSNFFSPIANFLKIPSKLVPLILLKPISGSGSIALLNNIFAFESPDSTLGKMASVIACSTETTFYTIAMYFGSIHLKNYRHTVVCALFVDFCALVAAIVLVKTSIISI